MKPLRAKNANSKPTTSNAASLKTGSDGARRLFGSVSHATAINESRFVRVIGDSLLVGSRSLATYAAAWSHDSERR